jgi:hypothetical protein
MHYKVRTRGDAHLGTIPREALERGESSSNYLNEDAIRAFSPKEIVAIDPRAAALAAISEIPEGFAANRVYVTDTDGRVSLFDQDGTPFEFEEAPVPDGRKRRECFANVTPECETDGKPKGTALFVKDDPDRWVCEPCRGVLAN